MIDKKYSEILFITIMGLGMSIIMTLVITYINTGMVHQKLYLQLALMQKSSSLHHPSKE